MTLDELITRALACTGATEDYPFGDDLLTVKVGGKVFCWIPLTEAGWLGRGPRMAVKLPADLVIELGDTYPGEVHPARPLDQRYWIAVPLDGSVPDSEIDELLAVSYREVFTRLPRRLRSSIDPGPA